MATTTRRLTDLSGQDLAELLALVEGSDSVELKLTIPEQAQRPVVAALGLDPIAGQIRQVFFFDTPELTLSGNGLVVRARRVQGHTGDTVVKLRPVVPAELPDDVRRSRSLTVEVDAMPGGYVCSASMKAKAANEEIHVAVTGGRRVRKLFTKEQRGFLAAHAPEGVALDDLAVLGPIFVLKAKFQPPGFERRFVAELWLYPDGSRILELSTKCLPGEAFSVAVESRAYLEGLGLEVWGEQMTKTKTALEFFAGELAQASPA
jgi:hypothetical protein